MVRLVDGATVCACGTFPGRAALDGLRVDGRPVEASIDSFGRVATLRLPPDLTAGTHTIHGTPDAGYGPDAAVTFRAVTIASEAAARLPFLPFVSGIRLRITVQGTEEPVLVRVETRDPDLLVLRGGPVLEVRTSGGPRNQALVRARETGRAGRATVSLALAVPPCPCTAARERGLGAERVSELEACLGAAVPQIRAWFDGRMRELAHRARLGEPLASQVSALVDELERRLLEVLATPDLAALRAWVVDELAAERERVATAGGGTAVPPLDRHASAVEALAWQQARPGRAGAGPGVAGAAPLTAMAAQPSPPGHLGRFRDRISSFFGHLEEVSRDLVVDLCVRARPSGANVWVHPERYPEGASKPQATDTVFKNLSRGNYVGGVGSLDSPPLFGVDLVKRYAVYVRCDLSEAPACRDEVRPGGFQCVTSTDD